MKKELTWVADPRRSAGGRWRKKYKGQLFWFSDIQGKSDRAGYQRAVQALTEWRATIDLHQEQNKPHQDHYHEAIALRKDMLTWLAMEQDPDPIRNRLLAEAKALDTELSKNIPRPISETGIFLDPIHRTLMPMSEMLTWLDRLESLRQHQRWTKHAAADNTLDGHIADYLSLQLKRAQSGQITTLTYKGYRDRTEHFRKWLTANSTNRVTPKTVTSYHAHLLNLIDTGTLSEQHGSTLFGQARSVIRWLYRNGACELPNNLDDPLLTIQVTLKEIEPFTQHELTVVWDNASDRTKLYALLMLNCGMQPADIAALRASEYDGSTITRRRTKTGRRTTSGRGKKVPVVSWHLWEETRRLLDKFRTHNNPLLLLNDNGQPLIRSTLKDDASVSTTNNVDSAWDRLVERARKKGLVIRPLTHLRKTGSSKLEEHLEFGRFSQYFLGHAPGSMTESRYAKPSPANFTRAVIWLGQQFGFD